MNTRLLAFIVAALLLMGLADSAGAFTLRQLPDIDYSRDDAASTSLHLDPMGSSETDADYKSPGKALMYSLLLPGLGHQYVGDNVTARRFFLVEAAIVTSLIVFEVEGHLRQDEYETFAQQFAGVSSSGHSDDYWALLTQYNSSRDYEAQIKSEGRYVFFPGGTAGDLQQYFLQNRISDYEPWEWDSADRRRAYQDRRSASKQAFRRGVYALAAGLANRVASGFFAMKASRDRNARRNALQGFRLEFGPAGSSFEPETGVAIVRSF